MAVVDRLENASAHPRPERAGFWAVLFPPCFPPASSDEQLATSRQPAESTDLIQLSDFEQARSFLASTPAAHVLVLMHHPIQELALALKSGQSLPEAIQTCRDQMESALAFFRADRPRILMANLEEAILNPAALAQAVIAARGLELPTMYAIDAPTLPDVPKAYRAFAMLSFSERPENRRLLSEFEAGLLPIERINRNRSEWEEGIAEIARLEAETDRLRALAGIEQQYIALKADFEVVARGESSMTQRNMVLLQEISALEATQQQTARDLAQAQAKLTKANHNARALEAHLEAFLKSTSWRITSPLRAIKLAIMPSKKG